MFLPIHINPKYQKEIGHVKLTYKLESPWNTLDFNVAQLFKCDKDENPNKKTLPKWSWIHEHVYIKEEQQPLNSWNASRKDPKQCKFLEKNFWNPNVGCSKHPLQTFWKFCEQNGTDS